MGSVGRLSDPYARVGDIERKEVATMTTSNKCQDCGAVTDFFLCDVCEDAMFWEQDLQNAECDCGVCG